MHNASETTAGPVTPAVSTVPAGDGYSRANIASLLAGHCAGMLDLVALPVWVGASLVGWFHFDPQQAGLLATLFLGGEVLSSLLLAPRFGRVPARLVAVCGYSVAGLAFLGLSMAGGSYLAMAALHLLGGVGAGCALTMVHGTMGRSARPHRLFAYAGFTLACFGIVVLGSGPAILAAAGGHALFLVFAGIMTIAAILAALAFPSPPARHAARQAADAPLSPRIWFGMAGMGIFCMAQSMIFPFVERIGVDRGYSIALVSSVLMAIGLSNLVPTPLAAALERRVRAEAAIFVGVLCHAVIILVITQLPDPRSYAVGVAIISTPLLFVHTFLFGLLARLDPSGRSVAATPAMVMIGSTIGPVLGGTLVMSVGYAGLGLGVAGFGLLAACCFYRMGRR
jgi:predicted MFS family arabinose efflux permease